MLNLALAGLASSALGFLGQSDTNKQNAEINANTLAYNSAEAQRNREFQEAEALKTRTWQESMRANQWVTSVQDMKNAGINPMVAYGSGGAGNLSGATASGSQASASPQIAMQNKVAAAMTNSSMLANIKKTEAETDLIETQAEKMAGVDTENVRANTTNTAQQTENLKETLYKIKHEIENVRQDTMNKFTQEEIMRQQIKLSKIDQQLRTGQISNTAADTALKKVITELRKNDVPMSENLADYARSAMGKGEPYARGSQEYTGAIGGAIGAGANGVKAVITKGGTRGRVERSTTQTRRTGNQTYTQSTREVE